MQINKETLQKIAHLSRLEITEQDEQKMIDSLNEIIAWVQKLEEVDTTNVEPLTHLTEEVNAFRDDIVLPPLSHEKGLLNAPKKDADYFRVPKVVD
ncbi:Asp-tRNA(Asn)/Glu-tRNA(Gln) amidotransferase subunit GatC [Thermoflexibacter ruber]|uniref:Aspartyl/glutamyl-tRNA(Asn/Gln) amidotransferase subunit C n=1 Tax=Thermoflexibacter ruber TaxID=1003 RepID=A0A1I2G424_9BACT|nr:Asp-tRNA(Asn)/Glu-tRNA(Gln) amidotransferase subunit GatC [Thermoflexibacter ruber]SFF11737.1 aspartyl/glutamyl-tRNA(Asn/Gln) amidotransferase subunit C [Thermoflexibacter ruber]